MAHAPLPPGVTIRTDVRPGDAAVITRMHGEIYVREQGFDATFSAYVDRPLNDFTRAHSARECLWIAEQAGRIVGSVAIVAGDSDAAQPRWFLVDPQFRGSGIGRFLLGESLSFAKECGYSSIYLWTVRALARAAHLYRASGFQKTEEKPGHWGVEVLEEKYELRL